MHIFDSGFSLQKYAARKRGIIRGSFIARLVNEIENDIQRLLLKDLQAMTDAAGSRPVILINPRLKVFNGKLPFFDLHTILLRNQKRNFLFPSFLFAFKV